MAGFGHFAGAGARGRVIRGVVDAEVVVGMGGMYAPARRLPAARPMARLGVRVRHGSVRFSGIQSRLYRVDNAVAQPVNGCWRDERPTMVTVDLQQVLANGDLDGVSGSGVGDLVNLLHAGRLQDPASGQVAKCETYRAGPSPGCCGRTRIVPSGSLPTGVRLPASLKPTSSGMRLPAGVTPQRIEEPQDRQALTPSRPRLRVRSGRTARGPTLGARRLRDNGQRQ